jgi:acetyl-CoA acyltransferase 1
MSHSVRPAKHILIVYNQVSDSKAAYYVRAACLAAGFPTTTAASSVNRFCSSGLKAVQDIAAQIQTGAIEVGVAVGAEHMSTGGDRLTRPFVDEIVNANQHAADCLQPMGQTSENVGADFNITREQQDRYAAESYRRAETAQKAGWFEDEITPITVKVKDPKTGEEKDVTLTKDEGPRWGTTFEGLNKIRPAFPDFGDRSTGGNSSQVTDGAAAILLMKRSKALELGQPILAKFVGATVAGLAPRIMGIGPSIAVPKLLTKYNIDINDIDLVELNEAFASMAVYCKDVLKIDHSKLNVRGGAIALVSSFFSFLSYGLRTVTNKIPGPPSRLHRRKADRHRSQRVPTPQGQGPAHHHVHWHWYGHGWSVRQRANVDNRRHCTGPYVCRCVVCIELSEFN